MGARSAVATAWLATEHQQLMYLLSPEGKTVFYIPGVEVVHKVSSPINLPDEASKMEPGKMQPPPGGSRTRSWSLPRPQLSLREEEQAGAEPAHLPGRADALAHLRQSEPPGSNDLAAANTLATLSTASVAGRSIEVHRSLPEPHRSLDVHKSLLEAPQNPGIPLSVQASSHSRPASAASGSYDSETYLVP